jgi:hypothetical protein
MSLSRVNLKSTVKVTRIFCYKLPPGIGGGPSKKQGADQWKSFVGHRPSKTKHCQSCDEPRKEKEQETVPFIARCWLLPRGPVGQRYLE